MQHIKEYKEAIKDHLWRNQNTRFTMDGLAKALRIPRPQRTFLAIAISELQRDRVLVQVPSRIPGRPPAFQYDTESQRAQATRSIREQCEDQARVQDEHRHGAQARAYMFALQERVDRERSRFTG